MKPRTLETLLSKLIAEILGLICKILSKHV